MRIKLRALYLGALAMLLVLPLHAGARTSAIKTAQRPSAASPIFIPLVVHTTQPAYEYADAMRDEFRHEAIQPNLPHYDLALRVDPVARRLSGRVELWFRNTTGAPLRDVVIRLYPNVPSDLFGNGGDVRMSVRDVVVQHRTATPQYEAQDTAVRVPLQSPVASGHVVTLALNFEATFSTSHPQDGSFALPAYYPMLAAWHNGWRTDVSQFPDQVYANSALYHARITVPGGWTVVSTGSNVSTSVNRDGSTTFEAVSGPVREFAFSIGRFASVSAEHEGTLVVVWYEQNSGLANVAASALADLKRALSTYNQEFGAYPYRALEMQLILDTRSFNHGFEHPGLIYIYSDGSYTTATRTVVSHELAHQWFFGVLGNDIFNEAWLDEAFAQYSPYFVEQQWFGQAAADSYHQIYIKGNADRATKPAGLSVWEYAEWLTYYRAVYGRGALFLDTLRLRIGDRAFFDGMRDYYDQHKYGVVHKADFLAAMEATSGHDLDALFLQWLGR